MLVKAECGRWWVAVTEAAAAAASSHCSLVPHTTPRTTSLTHTHTHTDGPGRGDVGLAIKQRHECVFYGLKMDIMANTQR